jgi:hypothetical protein
MAVLAWITILGSAAADSGSWKETVIVPTKNITSTLSVSRAAVRNQDGSWSM